MRIVRTAAVVLLPLALLVWACQGDAPTEGTLTPAPATAVADAYQPDHAKQVAICHFSDHTGDFVTTGGGTDCVEDLGGNILIVAVAGCTNDHGIGTASCSFAAKIMNYCDLEDPWRPKRKGLYRGCADRPVVYQRFAARKTWREARDHCASDGAHLVTIGSAEENAFVHTNFAPQPVEIWIGASDEVDEGDWQWVTGEDWDYTNWKFGEPNDWLTGEDYAIMSSFTGEWVDYRGYVDGGGAPKKLHRVDRLDL